MKIKAYVELEVKDKNGKRISYFKKEARSFVGLFISQLYCLAGQITLASQTDTGGTARTMSVATTSFSLNAASADATYGPVVGTGTNAVNISDTALQTKIAHGTGAGQLSHGTTTFTAPTTVGGTRSFTVQRTFTNNSGGNITVNEIGLYQKSNTGFIFIMDRTIATGTITNGTSGTLTYTIQVTV